MAPSIRAAAPPIARSRIELLAVVRDRHACSWIGEQLERGGLRRSVGGQTHRVDAGDRLRRRQRRLGRRRRLHAQIPDEPVDAVRQMSRVDVLDDPSPPALRMSTFVAGDGGADT